MSALSLVRVVRRRLAAALREVLASGREDDELREELESHLAMHIEDNLRRGMSPDEARRAALLAAGGLTLAAESVRARRGLPLVENLARDVRYAWRALRARPGFAAAVVLTLALGIGANAAMFTVVNAVVLHPLPYPQPGRVVSLSDADNGDDLGVMDDHTYAVLTASARTMQLAAYWSDSHVLRTRSGPEELAGLAVTSAYFGILGVRPLLGRYIDARDSSASAPPAVVLSEQLWRRALDADPSIVGRTITLDDEAVTVTGVMPARFTTSTGPQLWVPFHIRPSPPGVTRYWFVVGRLRDGATLQRAAFEARALVSPIPVYRPGETSRMTPVVMTLADRRYGEQRKPLLLLWGAVIVLLLIACANLANLTLVRVAARQREFAVRLALGGGRWSLARLLLSEALLLSVAGAVLGLLVSVALVSYFVHLSPASVGNPDAVHLDAAVLVFTIGVALASAVAVGLAPALLAGRGDVARVLSSGTPRASIGGRQHALRQALVVWQLATALVLLTGAGLVAHSFWRVTSIDLGFRPDGLLSVAVRLPRSTYGGGSAGPYHQELMARLRRVPGVMSVALGVPPLSGLSGSYSTSDSTGHLSAPIDEAQVGPGFFKTIGAHIVQGREFDSTDTPGTPLVVVVNTLLARRLFPEGNAVGRTMAGPSGRARIVGVVSAVRPQVEGSASPLLYPDVGQQGIGRYEHLLVRTGGPVEATERAIVQVARAIDPRLPPPAIQRMDQVVARAVAPRAFVFVLLSLFAGVAALLAAIGLYGVLSRVVTERTREIGIRIALGADPGRLTRAVLQQGIVLAALGTTLGVLGAIAAVRVMRSLVYDTSVYDPWTWAAGPLLLVLVSLLASYVPARRATRVDPIVALRQE